MLPTWGHLGLAALFVASICIILTMYGGGFSTVPAYLADIFGTQMVGAIHGRLITAWSVAGVVGPWLIASLRQFSAPRRRGKDLVYDRTLYIMAGILFIGLICNLLVQPVHDKNTDDRRGADARERALQREVRAADADTAARGEFGIVGVWRGSRLGFPSLIGLYIALSKAAALL